MAKKPSKTQLKVLRNLADERLATHGFSGGMSMSGGLSGTFVVLRREGWTDRSGLITEAGRAALVSGSREDGE